MSTYRTELDNGKTIHKKSATATPAGWHSCRDSSHLGKFLYVPDEKALLMKFQNGSVYQYEDVSPALYQGLLRCDEKGESVGEYFYRHISSDAKKHKVKQLL
jgi:hypothetical protein